MLLLAGTIPIGTGNRRLRAGAAAEALLLENSRMDTPASGADCGRVRSTAGPGDHAFPFDGTRIPAAVQRGSVEYQCIVAAGNVPAGIQPHRSNR